MGSLATLNGLIALDVPGASALAIAQAVSVATREFCRRTEIWANELSPFDMEAEQQVFELNPELDEDSANDQVEIVAITKVLLTDGITTTKGTELTPGRDYYMQGDGQMYLVTPRPNALTAGLVITIALRPIFMSDFIDDQVLLHNAEALAHGARRELLLQPKKPWTNAQLGGYHSGLFEKAIGDMKYNLARGFNTRGDLTVTQRVF